MSRPRGPSSKGRGSNAARSASSGGKTPPSRARRGAKPTPLKLRIIGGQMRGRPIEYHGAEFTRPMKDNIRENLFNILGRAIRGADCFDLFAGTGALAFESVSRGARSAVAVEQNRSAAETIRRTAEKLDVQNRVRVLNGDAFLLASSLLGIPDEDIPWIVFVCPPYALWRESLGSLQAIIRTTLDHAPPGSVLAVETEASFDADQLPGGPWDIRQYGGTRLAFIEPAMQCGMRL